MKPLHTLLASLALVIAGGCAFAAEAVEFGDRKYSPQFKFFIELQTYDQASWDGLSPEQQEEALLEVSGPAQERQQAMAGYYAAAMARWDSARLRDYCSQTTPDDVALVKLWMGALKGTLFEKKLALTRAMLDKAESRGLEEADIAALRPHLTEEALADLRSVKAAEDLRRQADPARRANELPKENVNAAIGGMSGALSDHTGRSVNKVFDGSTGSGDVSDPVRAGGAAGRSYEIPREAVKGTVAGATAQLGAYTAKNTAAAIGAAQPRGSTAPTVKSAAPRPPPGAGTPPADKKSSAWTSDAYGYTIVANGQTSTYRNQKEAEAAIRALPAGSVSKITLYGHGSPGMQTVGNATYEAGDTAQLLKGKMAPGGVIQYSGCNTASIGGATLNPAVGISMLTRRLMYFSLPYLQDRMDGVPAAQAKQQWEKGWDADLSRDTSLQMKGAIVCGYRTFGLVPGRLPGLTKLMGNQEATTPGYVAGKTVCYQDGKEVPAP